MGSKFFDDMKLRRFPSELATHTVKQLLKEASLHKTRIKEFKIMYRSHKLIEGGPVLRPFLV